MQTEGHQIEIDDEADAAYVRVRSTPVARTDEIADGVLIDFDAADEIVGVEVLDVHMAWLRGSFCVPPRLPQNNLKVDYLPITCRSLADFLMVSARRPI